MDWDALFNYLGTGGGLIVLLNWLAGLPLLRRKQKLDRDDVSRQMAARDNETIIRLYDEVRTFQERLAAIEGCMAKMVVLITKDVRSQMAHGAVTAVLRLWPRAVTVCCTKCAQAVPAPCCWHSTLCERRGVYCCAHPIRCIR